MGPGYLLVIRVDVFQSLWAIGQKYHSPKKEHLAKELEETNIKPTAPATQAWALGNSSSAPFVGMMAGPLASPRSSNMDLNSKDG